MIRLDRVIDKRGGGIMFYVKIDTEYEMLNASLNVSNENIEIMSIVINKLIMCQFGIYTP